MRDFISIGSSPVSEECAQVGSDDYDVKSRLECKVFASQLRRQFGDEPGTANISIKSFSHDFGSYREVVCYYDEDDDIGRGYAYKLESEALEYWDELAKKELIGDLVK